MISFFKAQLHLTAADDERLFFQFRARGVGGGRQKEYVYVKNT